MRKQPGTATSPTESLTVLSISPFDEDHSYLEAIVRHSKWMLFIARDLVSARALLQRHDIAVVLCERDLLPGTWIDVLEHTNALPHPPSLIVTSRFADDRLWSVALNLGAWDVLAKPFNRNEAFRSVKSGWQHWHDQTHLLPAAGKVMTAAS